MDAQQGLKLKRTDSRPGGKSSIPKSSPKKTKRDRTRATQAKPGAPTEFRQAHRARRKTERGKPATERSSSKTKHNEGIKSQKDEALLNALGEAGRERRISFVVRVTVNKQGEVRHTEIEHARSRKKEIFPSLDLEQLAAFMRARIRESMHRNVRMVISDMQIFRASSSGSGLLTFDPDEKLLVQIRFRLESQDASAVATEGTSYEVKIYARELRRGESKRLTSIKGNLAQGELEYTLQAECTGLLPGLYHLLTQATLLGPIHTVAYYEGPTLVVNENPTDR